jgi:hypothetical protein
MLAHIVSSRPRPNRVAELAEPIEMKSLPVLRQQQLQGSRGVWVPPPVKALDEGAWQAWAEKGRAQDVRSSAAGMTAVKWVSIAALLAATGLWSHLMPFEVVVRFIVASGAIFVMLQALHSQHYVLAAVFGALALLYNPAAPAFSLSGGWQLVAVFASTMPFVASLVWRNARPARQTALGGVVSKSALTSFLVFGMVPAVALAGDLSKYRKFQLGTDLPTVARQLGASPSQARVIHRRPALIQELAWRPQPLGSSTQTEPVKEVVFSFYGGELFRIVVNYDRYETEGMTGDDLIEVVSATYGHGVKPTASAKATDERFGDQEEVLARWQDSQYRYDLIRSSYGPSFRLTGVLKRLEGPAQAAILEATRLDEQEAPQRDAERIATDQEADRAKLERARLVNKPNFRP